MADKDKSQWQPIEKLAYLRQQVANLEAECLLLQQAQHKSEEKFYALKKQAEIELAQRNTELLTLQYAGATIASSLDLEFVLNTFSREMSNLLGVERCVILTCDQAGDRVMVMAEYSLPARQDEETIHLLSEFPLVKHVLAGRRARQVTLDQATLDPDVSTYLRELKIKTLLLLPMEARGQVVGFVAALTDCPERVFDSEEVALAQLLANQAAIAVENARLYAQAQQEIRERTQAEQELRQSEAKNRALLDAIPDLMFRLARAGEYLDCHLGQDGSHPISAQVGVGKNVRDVLPADLAALILDVVGKTLSTGTMQIFEYRWQSSPRCYDYEMRFVVSGPDEVLGIIRNITERKKMEEQAIQAERLATLGRLSAALTHEINNPLQSMQTHLDLMLDFTLEPGEDKKFLQVIRQEVERLNGITRRILNLASPQPTRRRRVFVADLLQEVLLLVGKHLQQHKIQVTLDFQEVLPILAAPDQLTQIFLNLVINAIEALPEFGQLHIAVYPDKDQAVISFINNGPAIPPEVLPHIFELFFTTKPEGTGVGLWVSHSLIRQHGGVFTVKNLEKAQGVAFTIKLPTVSSLELNNDPFSRLPT